MVTRNHLLSATKVLAGTTTFIFSLLILYFCNALGRKSDSVLSFNP